MSELAIRVRGLCKSYSIRHETKRNDESTLAETVLKRLRNPLARTSETETFHALKDVDFDVKKGDVVGVIGRNGAGKSTLLKILSRITEPTSGRIELYGRIGSLLEVGTGFHPELTGRENIYLNGAILGMSRSEIKKQFDAIVDFAGVEKFLDTPVKRYSSGMYVRLAFAVAAHLRSEILIIDEVLAVGDSEFQSKCLSKMKDVANNGRTVLFVSHNMPAVEALTNTGILLKAGQIVSTGKANKIVSEYLNDFSFRDTDALETFRSRGTGPQRITSIACCDESGNTRKTFRPKENLYLQLEVESPSIGPWDIAFAIEHHTQAPLFSSHLSDNLPLCTTIGKARFRIKIEPNLLRRGQYLISTGIYSDSRRDCSDELLHYPLFEVDGFAPEVPHDDRWGVLYLPLQWNYL